MATVPANIVPLPHRRRGLAWVLGLGAFGLAFSLTTTAAYLPPLLQKFTDSRTMIALVLGSEGLFALTLPLVIGPWSDTFQTPMGRRRPFMLVALPPFAFCLALIAFMPRLWLMTLLLLAFFFAYYVYEPPYRGLYPDLLPESEYGRSQGIQHLLRGVAIGCALVGGGFLFSLWGPAPFLIASVVVTAACAVPIVFVHEPSGSNRVFEGVRAYVAHSWVIFRGEPEVRRFLVCNSAWEGTFAGARTFVVLYITRGLGQSVVVSTEVLACVAGGYVVAALFAGRLGDRFGLARVIYFSSFVYGIGLLLAGLARTWHVVVPRADLHGRDRRRRRDDARVGAPLQADAAGAPRHDLGARDDDERRRADHRPDRGGHRDRPPLLAPAVDGRLPGAVADPRDSDPRRDPARPAHDAPRARQWHGIAPGRLRPKPQSLSSNT